MNNFSCKARIYTPILLFLCAVQLQHLVEVILVHARGVAVAYLQVQVVVGCADGGVSLFH